MRKPKPSLTAGLRPLKRVEGRLPYVFDMLWDVKDAEDIDRFKLRDNPQLHRLLAEHGYDVRAWLAEGDRSP